MITPFALLTVNDESDRRFLERLYGDYYRLMYGTAYKILKRPQGLDDVVGEVCIVMVRKVKILRRLSRDVLRGYIISCTRNAAVHYAKQETRRYCQTVETNLTRLTIGEQEDEVPSADRIIHAEIVAIMMECIEHLSERDRDILRMKYFDNLSGAEIADALGVKPVTARSSLSRARRRALRMFKEKYHEEE